MPCTSAPKSLANGMTVKPGSMFMMLSQSCGCLSQYTNWMMQTKQVQLRRPHLVFEVLRCYPPEHIQVQPHGSGRLRVGSDRRAGLSTSRQVQKSRHPKFGKSAGGAEEWKPVCGAVRGLESPKHRVVESRIPNLQRLVRPTDLLRVLRTTDNIRPT